MSVARSRWLLLNFLVTRLMLLVSALYEASASDFSYLCRKRFRLLLFVPQVLLTSPVCVASASDFSYVWAEGKSPSTLERRGVQSTNAPGWAGTRGTYPEVG